MEHAEVTFTLDGEFVGKDETNQLGVAQLWVTLEGPPRTTEQSASFAGDEDRGPSSDTAPFEVRRETTRLSLDVTGDQANLVATARLVEEDGAPLAGETIRFSVKGAPLGSAETDEDGEATLTFSRSQAKPGDEIQADFDGNESFEASSAKDKVDPSSNSGAGGSNGGGSSGGTSGGGTSEGGGSQGGSGGTQPSPQPTAQPEPQPAPQPSPTETAPATPPTAAASIEASADRVRFGRPVSLGGRVDSEPACAVSEVALSERVHGTTSTELLTRIPVKADGRWSQVIRPRENASYSVRPIGSDGCVTSGSAPVDVLVHAAIALERKSCAVVSGAVLPARAGTTVELERRIRGEWVPVDIDGLDRRSAFALRPDDCSAAYRVVWEQQSAANERGIRRFRL